MANRILGLDIGQTEIKAVLAEVTWRSTTLLGAYTETVPSPAEVEHRLPPTDLTKEPDEARPEAADEEIGEDDHAPEPDTQRRTPPPWVYAAADLIRKQGLEFNEVHVAMPGYVATSRILTLPFDNRRRLEQVLPFELEGQVPFDLDKMHLSFEVLGKAPEGGFRILVVLTPRPEIERFLDDLADAGIDPKVVDLTPYTLFAAARQALTDEMGAYAVVDVGANFTNLTILNEGELVDLRSLPFGSAKFDQALADVLKIDVDKAEQIKIEKADFTATDAVGAALRQAGRPWFGRLRQTLQGVKSDKDIDITRVYLTGRGSLLRGLPQILGDELGVEVERLASWPADGPLSIDPQDPADQARFATPLALVNRGLGVLRSIKLNLRHGQFVYSRQQIAFQSSLRSVAVIGAIVLVLMLYNVIAGQMQKRRQYDGLRDQIVELYMKAFPGGAPPLRPLDQFKGQISKTMAKHKTVGFLGDANLRAIEILRIMSEQIPPTVKVDIKKLDLSTEAIKFEGEVASFPDVDKIEEAFKKFSGFKQVKKETSSTVSEQVKFKFHIGLVEKKAKTTGKGMLPTAPTPAGES